MNDTEFHLLTVKEMVPETEDTVTVKFSIPADLADDFKYKAGQYLTLRFVIDGQDVRRAYSMSSSPMDPEIAVTVKRVKGGLVSNHIPDHLSAGSEVHVMPPQGRFLAATDGQQRKDYYLIGAGSGITPLMSILRTVLEEEPKSCVHLLYGSRDEESIIFKAQLAELEQHYAGQLNIMQTLSRPMRKKSGGLASFFTRGKVTWEGQTGRINQNKMVDFLEAFPQQADVAEYYICGPGDMIDTAESFLLGRGVPKEHIHTERFVSAHDSKKDATGVKSVEQATVKAKVNGKEVTIQLKAGQSILDGLLDAKADPPYSCLAGACSTCAAKVIKGSVRMEVCYALDDDEVADGMVLTCQCYPTSSEVEVDYEL